MDMLPERELLDPHRFRVRPFLSAGLQVYQLIGREADLAEFEGRPLRGLEGSFEIAVWAVDREDALLSGWSVYRSHLEPIAPEIFDDREPRGDVRFAITDA